MATVNHGAREITFKIVYCGTPLGGKTTNLTYIHSRLDDGTRGDLVSLATANDRTLFFDFLPLKAPETCGYKTKFQLYTVPGQVVYNATRQLVLRGADGIVFVADSQMERLEENVECLHYVEKGLRQLGTSLTQLPTVYQYNKRDLANAAPTRHLEAALNRPGHAFPNFEACASSGIRVFETLNAISGMVLQRFQSQSQAESSNTVMHSSSEGLAMMG